MDKNTEQYHQCSFHDDELLVAEIVCAHLKGHYLLSVLWTNNQSPDDNTPVSRFVMDSCERLNITSFKKTVSNQVNLKCANYYRR